MTSPSSPLPLEDAQSRLLALVQPVEILRLPIEQAPGHYLAEPLFARRTQPAADLSAMDGYAVGAHDLTGPWRVVGESAAGHPWSGEIGKGLAVRVATGSLMPSRSDCVILQEDITRDGDAITLTGKLPEPPDKHIRRAGFDFADGAQILPEGTHIGPAQAALAIAAGHDALPVRRKLNVAIVDSGDELAVDPLDCAAHQIPASNGVMLQALVRSLPCEVMRLGPVADRLEALATAFSRCDEADVIVTSGGASVGDHDLIRPALEAWGARIDFWRVAIKPGKPLLVATRQLGDRRQIVIGLPGNPVSSMVTAHLFLLPVLRCLMGAASPLPRRFATVLGAPVKANGPRREFLRAQWNGEMIFPQAIQDSGALATLAASNALLDRPSHAPAGQAGDTVFAIPLENGCNA